MTEQERKLKAAFFKLLDDFQRRTFYCQDVCPYRKSYEVWLSCPGKRWRFPDEPDDCHEAILNWYLRNVND